MSQPNAAVGTYEGRGWRQTLDGALIVAIAAIVAAIGNLIVYAVASSLGAIDRSVDLIGSTGLTPGLVPFASVIGVDLAAIAFLAVTHFSEQPVGRFRVIATIVLVLSFFPILGVPGASAEMNLTLLIMHIVAYAASMTLIPRVMRD